jgi:hypothetical protein
LLGRNIDLRINAILEDFETHFSKMSIMIKTCKIPLGTPYSFVHRLVIGCVQLSWSRVHYLVLITFFIYYANSGKILKKIWNWPILGIVNLRNCYSGIIQFRLSIELFWKCDLSRHFTFQNRTYWNSSVLFWDKRKHLCFQMLLTVYHLVDERHIISTFLKICSR